MHKVEPVVFQNKQGLNLFGIYHEPESVVKSDIAILLLSPGVKMRVAPHRLYKKMAETFVELGFPVFRFDFYALGDAEGEINEPILANVYNSILDGRFVEDTISGMDWMEEAYGINKFILSGLCGGAITGLLAAADDARVVGLLSLNMSISYEPSPTDRHRFLTEQTVATLRKGYWNRLLQPKSWLRLLTFKSEYKVILRVLKQVLLGQKKPSAKAVTPDKGKDGSDASVKGNMIPAFIPAFFKFMERRRKLLLIFCGADRWTSEYEEKFESYQREALKQYEGCLQKHVIENANHAMTELNWQNEMLEVASKWLRSY